MAAILLVFPSPQPLTHTKHSFQMKFKLFVYHICILPRPLNMGVAGGKCTRQKKSLFSAVALAFGLWLFMFELTAVAAVH